MERLRVAVLISGRGSNLRALLQAARQPSWPAEIALVASNAPSAAGLAYAVEAGVRTVVVDHRTFPGREEFEEALHAELTRAEVELVCLAGFMRLLTRGFVDRWRDRLINIHPSLLPSYKGLRTHERALADGVRITGCTVHFVRPEMDSGPIIVQAAVPVLDGDDPERLAARVLAAEHRCYPLAVRLVAEGRVSLENGRVRIDGAECRQAMLVNPE